MKNKIKILIPGIIIILLIIFSAICFLVPNIIIDINGNKYITITIGEEYIEEGAAAYLKKFLKKDKINTTTIGNVDSSKIGKYIVTYKAKSGHLEREVIRVVNVVDNEKPIITLKEDVKICQKNNLIEINAIAKDNYDGDISDKIQYKIKQNKAYISVSDSSNNISEIVKKVKYIDEEAPQLTLKGPKTIYLKVGQNYEELGVSAYDSCDGNISNKVRIENSVDINTPNTYQITYKIKDSLGIETKTTRTIIVSDTESNECTAVKDATIYLTFDDGPGAYTNQILEVLNKYNIKATFFVTNQFPNYRELIKKEYENGHSIGVHTYSHKWSIYESVETYLDDYKKMEDIVYYETGIRPKIFRFPGGSSNTVSKNYSKGIMSKLSQIMTNDGYIYFDWTFDSGDTNKQDNSTKAIINNIKTNLKGDGQYVILMHDIKKNTLEALPQIIEYAQMCGYKFSALDENSPTEHFKIAN